MHVALLDAGSAVGMPAIEKHSSEARLLRNGGHEAGAALPLRPNAGRTEKL